MKLLGEGLCAALNLRDSILCDDKLNLPAMQFALGNLFIKNAGRGGAKFRRGNEFGRARIFTACAIRSEILNFTAP